MRVKKWIISLLNLVAIIVVLANADYVIGWINDQDNGNLFIVFMIVILLAAVPGIPFGVVSGIIGAKYGVLWGSLLNIVSSTLAAVLVYTLFRYLLYQQGAALLKRYSSLRRMDELLQRHTFWAILVGRMIPIIPAALINIYSGVFGLSFIIFLHSTLLGKIPIMLVFTIVGDSMRSGSKKWVFVLLIYVLFLLIVYGGYRLLSADKKKYKS